MADIRLLLDEHYSAVLAQRLVRGGVDTESVTARDDLRGRDDTTVLRWATAEGRMVVTEDVTTFPRAIAAVPNHAGVIFADHERFPRTVAAWGRLEHALVDFASHPPTGAGLPGFVWWLTPPAR